MSLHSRYDPLREAERYVEAVGFTFKPACIVVTEPGESWLAGVLRKKYPGAILIALRYDTERFAESDSSWDAVWRPGNSITVDSFLFNCISDEYLPLTVFLPWKPADQVWPEQSAAVWNGIASLIRLQKDIMYTRSHFGKRWLANSLKNLVALRTVIRPVTVNKPVFLALAGPSLEKQFPVDSGKFFVCGVSSSVSCLVRNGCAMDLCLATDGGYWALPLFRALDEGVTVAFPLEAAIPSRILERNPAILLDYGSALEKELFAIAGIVPESAKRNGTVAGTAARYLLDHSSSSVYAAGLDLRNSLSFPHARPHVGLSDMECKTGRLDPASHELFLRNRESASLDVYASWFSSRGASLSNRFFRLAPEGRPLEGIKTVSASDVPEAKRDGSAQNVKPERQELKDVRTRKAELARFLEKFIDELEGCMRLTDSQMKILQFGRVFSGNALYAELLQMISYTGYIGALKKTRVVEGDGQAVSAIDSLCVEAGIFCAGLIRKVRQYGE